MAVRVAVELPLNVPTLAVKFALLWPAAMVTLDGTETPALLLLIVTIVLEAAAAAKETVQVDEEFEVRLVGVHDSVLNWAGATKLRLLVMETTPADAVTVAV